MFRQYNERNILTLGTGFDFNSLTMSHAAKMYARPNTVLFESLVPGVVLGSNNDSAPFLSQGDRFGLATMYAPQGCTPPPPPTSK